MNKVDLGKKSWVAYLKAIIISLVIWFLLIMSLELIFELTNYSKEDLKKIINLDLLTMIILLIVLTYNILKVYSYELYYDENGVWLKSGILPWDKGEYGIKWIDLGEAVFYKSAFSWLSGSYTIKIKNRNSFTIVDNKYNKYIDNNGIYLKDMAKGSKIVTKINDKLEELIKNKII